jgi:hypothetical protein
MTKEELLQKGISEDVVDEIMTKFEDKTSENSLQALQKALNKDEDGNTLFKAAKKGGNEDEDDYDEEYMKKHMKRYMKSQKDVSDTDMYEEKMKKAADDLGEEDYGIIDAKDMKPYLDTQQEITVELCKAVSSLSEQFEYLKNRNEERNEEMFDLLKKASQVQVEQAAEIEKFMATPQGKKGITSNVDPKQDLSKAITGEKITPEQNGLIYQTLLKAVKLNKDAIAGQIISRFEAARRNYNELESGHKAYIQKLIHEEGK